MKPVSILLVSALLAGMAFAEPLLEMTGSVSGHPYSRVDLILSSDADLGSFSILRMSSWGRGRGTEWVELSVDQLQLLQKLTILAASTKPLPAKAEVSAAGGTVKVIRTPKGEIRWQYSTFESPTVRAAIGLTPGQALEAGIKLGKLVDRLLPFVKTSSTGKPPDCDSFN